MAAAASRPRATAIAPTAHGDGDGGFVRTLVTVARERGVAGYVAEGTERWPAVHRSDAARLVRLAVERAPAGSMLHAVGEEGVPLRDIARVIGHKLRIPTASIAPDGALAHFGHLGVFVGVDCPASAAITRKMLGWNPTGPGLLDDLEAGHYGH